MSLVMAGFLFYVFFVGFIGESGPLESLSIDVTEIAPGEVKYFNAGKRKLLVLHRSPEQIALLKNNTQHTGDIYRSSQPEYFVAWAYDPFFGCSIEYRQMLFKAVCVNSRYDLAGRVYKGDASNTDLIVPDYQFVDDYRISVKVDD